MIKGTNNKSVGKWPKKKEKFMLEVMNLLWGVNFGRLWRRKLTYGFWGKWWAVPDLKKEENFTQIS